VLDGHRAVGEEVTDEADAGVVLAAIRRLWPTLLVVGPLLAGGIWWTAQLSGRVQSLEESNRDLVARVAGMTETVSAVRATVVAGNDGINRRLDDLIRSRQ
jgi:hypothetical protein